jgi:hypothetical protein
MQKPTVDWIDYDEILLNGSNSILKRICGFQSYHRRVFESAAQTAAQTPKLVEILQRLKTHKTIVNIGGRGGF